MNDNEGAAGAAAAGYVRRGWSVFPLWWVDAGRCGCPAADHCPSPGKHPLVVHGVHDASRSAGQVAAWWGRWPRANIGVPAGDNGLAVIDVDHRHNGVDSLLELAGRLAVLGVPLPVTLTQITGSGGLHLIYAAPATGIKGLARAFGGPGIDTRGRGNYIVAAPSVHVAGGRYTWADADRPPVAWPDVLTRLMAVERPEPARAQPEPATQITVPDAYAEAALRGEVERVMGAAEGSRNHTLNRAAFAIGQLVAAELLDRDDAVAALIDAGRDAGLTLTETRATVASGLRGGARHPRTGVAA